ncbi:peroxiredoxin family protein [Effusibacillus dendaii]|nr:redoxin domain-containing protein [Effusibacillus dendaii]
MPKADKGLRPGSIAPLFTLPGVDGETYRLERFRGRPVLLYFLRGTW